MEPGGMIALGTGLHRWDADTCIEKFLYMSREGLKKKAFTTTPIIGVGMRWFLEAIYDTMKLEDTMKKAYPEENLFGLRPPTGTDGKTRKLEHLPRLAVTTTVQSEARLLCNYNNSGLNQYLNSNVLSWKV
jgi:hypothetical protein